MASYDVVSLFYPVLLQIIYERTNSPRTSQNDYKKSPPSLLCIYVWLVCENFYLYQSYVFVNESTCKKAKKNICICKYAENRQKKKAIQTNQRRQKHSCPKKRGVVSRTHSSNLLLIVNALSQTGTPGSALVILQFPTKFSPPTRYP